MASRKLSDGKAVTVTAAAAMANGVFYQVSNFLGLCTKTAAIGELSALEIAPYEYETTQAEDVAYAVGETIYWDNANSRFTNTSGVIVGICTSVRGLSDDLVISFKRTRTQYAT